MAAWKPRGEKHACFSPSGSRAAIFCYARRTKRITHDGLSERGTTRSLVLHKHSLCKWKLRRWKSKSAYTLFCFIRMLFFPAQAEYSYFFADFRLITFLYSVFLNYSLWHFRFRIYWGINYKCLVFRSVLCYIVHVLHRFSLQSVRSKCHVKRRH